MPPAPGDGSTGGGLIKSRHAKDSVCRVEAPRSWLLRVGRMRHGRIDLREIPGSRAQRRGNSSHRHPRADRVRPPGGARSAAQMRYGPPPRAAPGTRAASRRCSCRRRTQRRESGPGAVIRRSEIYLTTDVDYDLCIDDESAGTGLCLEAQAPGRGAVVAASALGAATRAGRPLRGNPAHTCRSLASRSHRGGGRAGALLQIRGRGSVLPGAGPRSHFRCAFSYKRRTARAGSRSSVQRRRTTALAFKRRAIELLHAIERPRSGPEGVLAAPRSEPSRREPRIRRRCAVGRRAGSTRRSSRSVALGRG